MYNQFYPLRYKNKNMFLIYYIESNKARHNNINNDCTLIAIKTCVYCNHPLKNLIQHMLFIVK
jgi:hypothetical protein